MNKYNLDRVKICLLQPENFFMELTKTIKENEGTKAISYKGFSLTIIDDNDKDIKANLSTDYYHNTVLGSFIFNNSAKYGTKCFFTFSTKAMYENCVPEEIGEKKYNCFNYPFYVFDALGLRFNNVSYLEIACDTDTSVIKKIQYVVSHSKAFDMVLIRKKVTDPDAILSGYWEYYQRSRTRKENHPTLYVHSTNQVAGNRKELKIYDKARELIQYRPDKEEMTRAWNGMKKEIQRMEISVENKQFRQYFNTICERGSICWFPHSKFKDKSKMEQDAAFRESIKDFFFNLGVNEDLRSDMFDYFAFNLLHFKCRDHSKTQITLADLTQIPFSVLNQYVANKVVK